MRVLKGAEPLSVTLHLPSSVSGIALPYEWAVPEMKYSACSYPTLARSKFELCTTILPLPDVMGPSTVGTGAETFVSTCAVAAEAATVTKDRATPTTMTTNRFTNPLGAGSSSYAAALHAGLQPAQVALPDAREHRAVE